jgi:hypothetical protein
MSRRVKENGWSAAMLSSTSSLPSAGGAAARAATARSVANCCVDEGGKSIALGRGILAKRPHRLAVPWICSDARTAPSLAWRVAKPLHHEIPFSHPGQIFQSDGAPTQIRRIESRGPCRPGYPASSLNQNSADSGILDSLIMRRTLASIAAKRRPFDLTRPGFSMERRR